MDLIDVFSDAPIQTTISAIFFSMELSRSKWLITSLSPGSGERMSNHVMTAGDVSGLLDRLDAIRSKAEARTGRAFPFVSIQEAGLDGFWIHRVLDREGIESHVVDPASIAMAMQSAGYLPPDNLPNCQVARSNPARGLRLHHLAGSRTFVRYR